VTWPGLAACALGGADSGDDCPPSAEQPWQQLCLAATGPSQKR
jgi:hypothetical protein